MSEFNQWNGLPRPFYPGTVTPASDGRWCFTFRDGSDRAFRNQEITYATAWQAKRAMREFCGIK